MPEPKSTDSCPTEISPNTAHEKTESLPVAVTDTEHGHSIANNMGISIPTCTESENIMDLVC